MIDIVIDTCTLKHADDPKSKYFEHSIVFIDKMQANDVSCVVDTDFSMTERNNASYIGMEYIKHLRPGSLGYALITNLASTERLDFVTNQVPNQIRNYIEQIIRNKKDRIFLRVAYNSVEKVLASHDFEDYQISKRRRIRRDLNISIITADQVNPDL